jgi:type IV fimbrial biogenesis protein FimT
MPPCSNCHECDKEIGVFKYDRQGGFTLLELLVTISVAAIILSVGVPGFLSFIQNNRAVTHTNDLVTALNLGRSEATRRGTGVVLCSSTNGTTCSDSNDWSNGWIVRTSGGTLLRSWPERSGGAGVLTGNVSQIQFQARGSIAGVAPLLLVRLPNCSGNQGRDVAVNLAGRISVRRVEC